MWLIGQGACERNAAPSPLPARSPRQQQAPPVSRRTVFGPKQQIVRPTTSRRPFPFDVKRTVYDSDACWCGHDLPAGDRLQVGVLNPTQLQQFSSWRGSSGHRSAHLGGRRDGRHRHRTDPGMKLAQADASQQ